MIPRLETKPTWLDLKVHAEAAGRQDMLNRCAPRMLRFQGGSSAIPDSHLIDRQQAKYILDYIGVNYLEAPERVEEVIFERETTSSQPIEGDEIVRGPEDSLLESPYEVEADSLQVLVEAEVPVSRPVSVRSINDFVDVIGQHRQTLSTRNILGITVTSDDEARRIHNYINKEIEYFFHDVVQETPTGYIPYELSMAPASDLKTLNSQKEHSNWFYEQIFHDFGDRDQDGKLVRKLKFFITLDQDSAPMQIKHFGQRGADDRRYGTIDVGGGTMKEHRVCYIVYFTLQELLNVMKQKY
jgi:hypothetical protein